MDPNNILDPFAFVKELWGSVASTVPGMIAPALDPAELDKKIKDLKAVEGWLSMNLTMLQNTISSMEMQKNTLDAFLKMQETGKEIFSTVSNDIKQAVENIPEPIISPTKVDKATKNITASKTVKAKNIKTANSTTSATTKTKKPNNSRKKAVDISEK